MQTDVFLQLSVVIVALPLSLVVLLSGNTRLLKPPCSVHAMAPPTWWTAGAWLTAALKVQIIHVVWRSMRLMIWVKFGRRQRSWWQQSATTDCRHEGLFYIQQKKKRKKFYAAIRARSRHVTVFISCIFCWLFPHKDGKFLVTIYMYSVDHGACWQFDTPIQSFRFTPSVVACSPIWCVHAQKRQRQRGNGYGWTETQCWKPGGKHAVCRDAESTRVLVTYFLFPVVNF